jgi:hypothetical protein
MPKSPNYKNYKAKETVLVITVGCIVLYLVFKSRAFLYCALVIGLAGVLSFYLSEKIDWVWGKLSFIMGEISNRVLLTIIFLLVVTPVGLIRRLRKKNSLTYFDKDATSNFSGRDHTFSKKDLENTW